MHFSQYILILAAAASAASASSPKHALHKRAVDAAVGSQGVNANAANTQTAATTNVDLKQVASHLHQLSAHLEQDTSVADKVMSDADQQKDISVKLDSLVVDTKLNIDQTTSNIKTLLAQASTAAQKRNGVDLDLDTVTKSLVNLQGAGGLVTMLSSIKAADPVKADIASIFTNVDVLSAVHSIADVSNILAAVTSVTDSVTLLKNLQAIQNPTAFVSALKVVSSVPELLTAVKTDVPSLTKVVGSAKMVDFIDTFGSETVTKLACTTGAETLLTQIKNVVGSEKFVSSLTTVSDIQGFATGLKAIPDMPTFVTSVQSIVSVVQLQDVLGGLSRTTSVVGLKRDLLSGVTDLDALSTVKGLTTELPLENVLGTTSSLTGSGIAGGLLKKRDLNVPDVAEVDVAGLQPLTTVNGLESKLNVDQIISGTGLVQRRAADLLSTATGLTSDLDVNKVVNMLPVGSGVKSLPLDSVTSSVTSTVPLVGTVAGMVRRRDSDSEEQLFSVSLTTVQKDFEVLLPKLNTLLAKIDTESDVKKVSASIAALSPSILDLTTTLTTALNSASLGSSNTATKSQLLPQINQLTKITDGLLTNLKL